MSTKIIATNALNLQMVDLPSEALVKILGFLEFKDLRTVAFVCKFFKELQQTDSLWTGLFPQIQSLDLNVSAKERTRVLLTPIPLGSEEKKNRCILNLKDKTITMVSKFALYRGDMCLLAISDPYIPKGSFALYTYSDIWGDDDVFSGIFKGKDGTIRKVVDLKGPIEESGSSDMRLLAIRELRTHEKTDSPFHEYKLILDKDNPDYSHTITKASDYIRGKAKDPQ